MTSLVFGAIPSKQTGSISRLTGHANTQLQQPLQSSGLTLISKLPNKTHNVSYQSKQKRYLHNSSNKQTIKNYRQKGCALKIFKISLWNV